MRGREGWIAFAAVAVLLGSACAPAAPPAPAGGVALSPTPAPIGNTPSVAGTTPTKESAPVTAPAVKPRYGGVLRLAYYDDAPHYDMHQETTAGVHTPTAPNYSLLIQTDPLDETKIIPDWAESWEVSPDGKVYTFRLRKGVRFHDGTPATSKDAKASWDRIVWPPKDVFGPRSSLYDAALERVEAPDDYTVRFILKYPQASFLALVALPFNFIFPKHILDRFGQDAMKTRVIGTGPFKWQEHMRGVSTKVTRNPDYFVAGRPYLEGMIVYIIKDEGAQIAALRTRNIDLITSAKIRGVEIDRLREQNPDLRVVAKVGTQFYRFIPNVSRKPWDDLRVRKAAWLAIDRQAGLQVLAGGTGAVGGYIPSGPWSIPDEELLKMPGYRQPKEADRAEAKRLLSEAGFPAGFKAKILVSSRFFQLNPAIFLKDQLRQIGIDASIDAQEHGIMKNRAFLHDFETLSFGETNIIADPDLVFSQFFITDAGRNWGNWSDPKVDALYIKQSQSTDPRERRELVLQMQRLAMEGYGTPVIMWDAIVQTFWIGVKDYVPGTTPYSSQKFQDVWLAQ